MEAKRGALKERLVFAKLQELRRQEADPVRREIEEVERLNAKLEERGCAGTITVQQYRVVHALVVRSAVMRAASRFLFAARDVGSPSGRITAECLAEFTGALSARCTSGTSTLDAVLPAAPPLNPTRNPACVCWPVAKGIASS